VFSFIPVPAGVPVPPAKGHLAILFSAATLVLGARGAQQRLVNK
jgi:hypothetical protein